MAQYKTVAGPVGLTIGQYDSYTDAVRSYADIINRESVNGWRLYCIQEVPVTRQNGCMASLLGNPVTKVSFNMLVFVKDDVEDGNGSAPVSPVHTTPSRPIFNRPASPVPSNGWRCLCGRVHQNYETSCVCGVSKQEAKLGRKADGAQTSNGQNAPVSAIIKDGEKVCPKCGKEQKADRKVCWSCGQAFDN